MYIVFMAAGMSSRYGGKLKQMAKVGVNGETLIEVSVNQALTVPFKKIIFITNEKTEPQFREIFEDEYKGVPVMYVRQEWDTSKRNRPWGTTAAVCSLTRKIKEPIIIVNSDDIYGTKTFKEGYELLKETCNNIIGGCVLEKTMPVDEETTVNRALIGVDKETNLVFGIQEFCGLTVKENKDILYLPASVNFIGLRYQTLDYLQAILDDFQETHKNNPEIECLLPNDLNYLICNKLISMNYFEIENSIYGITYPGDEKHVKLMVSLYGKN